MRPEWNWEANLKEIARREKQLIITKIERGTKANPKSEISKSKIAGGEI